MEPGMSAVYSRLRLKCSGVRGGLLSACKWIFRVHRFCEDCLLAALTVSALPAVIDEPGASAPSPTPAKREGENCCSIISHDLTRLIMPPQILACRSSHNAASFASTPPNDPQFGVAMNRRLFRKPNTSVDASAVASRRVDGGVVQLGPVPPPPRRH